MSCFWRSREFDREDSMALKETVRSPSSSWERTGMGLSSSVAVTRWTARERSRSGRVAELPATYPAMAVSTMPTRPVPTRTIHSDPRVALVPVRFCPATRA